MSEQSIQDRIRKVLSRATADELSDEDVAQRVLEMGDEYDWRAVALDLLPAAVWAIRRQEARKREQRELEAMIRRANEREQEQEREAKEHGFDSYEEWKGHQEREQRAADALMSAQAQGYPTVEARDEAMEARWKELRRKEAEEYERRRAENWRRVEEAFAPMKAALEFAEAFLDSEFATGDGRRIKWGDATADDHVKRIEWMTSRIKGMEQDVDLHMRVLRVIEECGVETLREARQGVPA